MSPDKRRLLALATLLGLCLAAGMAVGRGARRQRADFAFCNQTEVSSLDPALATGEPEGRILRELFEGLTRFHARTLEPLPAAAERWDTSADGLTWTFHLRADARWTNGDPVTAHDFVYSFRRLLHPATGARYAYFLWVLDGAEAFTKTAPPSQPDPQRLGVAALSDTVLELRLHRPCPYLTQLTAYYPLFPVHRGCLEAHGNRWMRPENIVSNGPFRLVERRLRDRLRLRRFDGHWNAEQVRLQSVDAYAATGITTQLNLFLMGEVDWMIKPPPDLYRALADRPDVVTGGQLGVTFLRFNTWGGPFHAERRDSPFADARVRRALMLALDREQLARDVMRGGQQAIDSFVPSGLLGYEPALLESPDVDRARELLTQAGYPGGQGFPRFSLLYPHNETTRDFCDAVSTRWRRQLGLDIELVNQVFGVYMDSSVQGLYDVAWGAWTGDYVDPSTFLEIFLSDSGNNRTGWASPRYDELVAAAGGELDHDQRMRLFRQAESLLLDELPIAPVYQRVNINLVSTRVRGFADNLLDVHPLSDLWIEEAP